jgi:multicomponent Na+:H+ antiporter subunit D
VNAKLLAIPIAVPLLGAAISIFVGRWRTAQRVVSLVSLSVVAVTSVLLLVRVDTDGILVVQSGGWPAPIGITLVADRLAAIMLAVAALMLLAVLVYAIGQPGAERNHVGFHPVYLIMAAGVAGAFLTGDLFNLFVCFEVTLTASYVLITLGGRADQVRSGMTYVVISLLASILFLVALAFIYAATGTVNMADLAGKIGQLPPGVRSALALLLLVVFGIKAAIFPLFFWLPDSYPTAPTPVTAVFAGLLTKVGIYALLRTQTLLFPPETRPGELLLVIAGATMLVGVLGAIAQDDIKRILSFHIVSQVGYMVMGLGLFTLAGLAGAVLYIVHHIVVKTTLFLTAGLVELRAGSGRLARIGGLASILPVIALLFLLPALSLAGIPPFSGFVAKLALVEAGLEAREYLVVAISLAVSLLTLFSMTKIWANAFWGKPQVEPGDEAAAAGSAQWPVGGPILMVGATAALALVSVGIAVAAGPLYDLSERAAIDLIDREVYVTAVLGP